MEQLNCNLMMPRFSLPPSSSQHLRWEEKKKLKLTKAQRDLLEKMFSEGIRLDPARKTILANELGLDPRQVAVWFQNRRSRWKTKQLELSYHSLKLQLDAISLENQRLKHQVVELRAMLMEQAATRNNNQISMGCGGSDEEMVRKMLAATMHGGSAGGGGAAQESGIPECHNYMLNGNGNGIDYDLPPASYTGLLIPLANYVIHSSKM